MPSAHAAHASATIAANTLTDIETLRLVIVITLA
jgi:hypothetical protein